MIWWYLLRDLATARLERPPKSTEFWRSMWTQNAEEFGEIGFTFSKLACWSYNHKVGTGRSLILKIYALFRGKITRVLCGPFFVPHAADMPSHTPAESWQQQNGSRNARRGVLVFFSLSEAGEERGGFFTNKNQTFQQREVFYLAKSKISSSFGVWYHPVKSRWCFTSETCFLKKKRWWIFAGTSGRSKKNREVTHRILDDFFSWPVSLSVGWPKQRTPQVPQCSPRLMWTGQLILMEKAYFEFPTLHVPKKSWIAKRAARDSLEKLSQEGQWLEIGVTVQYVGQSHTQMSHEKKAPDKLTYKAASTSTSS